jgi:hypothetical protein
MWRKVPYGKRYVRVRDPDRQIHAANEVLLLHRAVSRAMIGPRRRTMRQLLLQVCFTAQLITGFAAPI